MSKALIVARDNGYGLSIDTELLSETLSSIGIEAKAVSPKKRPLSERLFRRKTADIVFHMERVFPAWVSAGTRNYVFPNQERFPKRHIDRLKFVDAVLAKTRHAQDVFAAHATNVHHVGFMSRDRYLPSVEKNYRTFFHLAGGSTLKGTDAILDAWKKNPQWPELVLVQKKANAPTQVPPNVTLKSGYIDDDALRQLQNRCGIHLCPSLSEGWGHHIHEGMSCGAVIVATDAPPMNEFVDGALGVLVPYANSQPRHLGTNFHVNGDAIETSVNELLAKPEAELTMMSQTARRNYCDTGERFQRNLRDALRPQTAAQGDIDENR